MTVQKDGTITGPEPTQVQVTNSFGGEKTTVNSSADQIGIGVEGGLGVVFGAEIGSTTEGLNALGDAFSQAWGAIYTPPPPPPPSPSVPDDKNGDNVNASGDVKPDTVDR